MGAPAEAPERLDSWKSIADYLDRDVATVRRWEKSQGLPVRRVPGGRGRSVFAFRHEIDEWLTRAATDGEAEGATDGDAAATLPLAPATRATLRWRRWIAVFALLAMAAAGITWAARARKARLSRLNVELTPAGIIARAASGEERWRYAFPPDARALVEGSGRGDKGVLVVNGDEPGYIAGTMYSIATADESNRSGELFWVGEDGTLRRRFSFNDHLQFGAGPYDPPWGITDYRAHPDLGGARVAVSAHHLHWWPSIVTLLDERWHRTQTFVNAGWIERLLWLDGNRLLIGGYNNALEGGMVAILDPNDMNGHWPFTDDPDYQCSSCGNALPLKYVVMPRSEVNKVTGSQFNRAVIEWTKNRVVVRTIEETRDVGSAAEAIYEFTPDLQLQKASFGDRYWEVHRALELGGRLDHPRERCPDKDGPRLIHVWTRDSGWEKVATR